MLRVERKAFGPRWRSGRSPSTPVRLCPRGCTPLCPTLQHNCRHSSHKRLSLVRSRTRFPCKYAGSCGGWGEDPQPRSTRRTACRAMRLHAELQSAGGRPYPRRDAPTPPPAPPLPAPDRRAARRLRRRRRRRRRRSREGGPGRHRDLLRGRRAPRGRPARRRARRRRQGPAHGRPGGQDPRADRQGAQGVRRTRDTSYEKDIAPWLGEKAGVWVTGVDRDGARLRRASIAAKDTEKAQEAIDKGVKDDGGTVKERSYEGVDYQVDDDGVAAGIVGDFFTVGTEAGVQAHGQGQRRRLARRRQEVQGHGRRASTRTGSGSSTSTSSRSSSRRSRPTPRPRSSSQQLRSIFPIDKLEPMAGALLADGDRIAFDTLMTRPGRRARCSVFAPFLGTGETPLRRRAAGRRVGRVRAPPNVGPG